MKKVVFVLIMLCIFSFVFSSSTFAQSSNTIYACLSKGGDLSQVSLTPLTCPKGLIPISWNIAGQPGQPGSPGQAATITVGTTTTGSPGSSASVTNSGTSSDAVLDFTIPQGQKGDTGPAGSSDTYTKHLPLAGDIPLDKVDGTTLAQLDLPVGHFVFMASAMFTNSGTEEDTVYCILEPQAEGNSQGSVVVPVGINGSLALTIAGTRSEMLPYPASLWCRSNRPGAETVVTQFDFTAIKVATLTVQP